jgi:DNA-binding winged helix-turn-helix (wHTH) protein
MLKQNRAAGDVELDLGRYELRRGGRRIHLERKPMELLIHLARHREQLVSREALIAKLWRSDLFIDAERNLNNVVRKLRTALADDPANPRFLETVIGKGYRLVGPLRVNGTYDSSTQPEFMRDAVDRNLASGHASLAVLPLVLTGKATDDAGLCLGFAEALISLLGNIERLAVLPASAVLNLPRDMQPASSASRLNVRFVVRGAIQKLKDQWHLSLELFDAHLPGARWTRRCTCEINQLPELQESLAREIAGALNRRPAPLHSEPKLRHSRDAFANAEFMRGFELSASHDARAIEEAIQRLTNAVSRDPGFALAHATLSFVCATRHFESDPARVWLEKAEFHCDRALELRPDLPEGHVSRAFLLWGPSKNFQHADAIAALKRALGLQSNLPQAYNRLGTILAHIGLLDQAEEMYRRGCAFHPRKQISRSVFQVHLWRGEFDRAGEQLEAWYRESPSNKYAIYFRPQPALLTGDWDSAKPLLDEALKLLPDEPLTISLKGLFHALKGEAEPAIECIAKACANPKTFGHAHHAYYQIACIYALLDESETAFEWLERSVNSGFACWPFFLKDPCLKKLRSVPEFELLVRSLQAKYPDHLGLL